MTWYFIKHKENFTFALPCVFHVDHKTFLIILSFFDVPQNLSYQIAKV